MMRHRISYLLICVREEESSPSPTVTLMPATRVRAPPSIPAGWCRCPGQARDRGCACLDCGEPLSIDVLDGVIQRADPEGVAFYVDVSVKKGYSNLPFS